MSNCFYCGSSEHVTSDCTDKGRSTKSPKPGLSLLPGSPTPDRAAAEFIRHLDDMLESGEFDWAEDTLSDIQETVSRTSVVTDNQRRAVENIGAKRGW